MSVQILDLPNEVLLRILEHVPTRDIFKSVSLVCKRFSDLSKEESLIKELTLNFSKIENKTIYNNVEGILKSGKASNLRKLTIIDDSNDYPFVYDYFKRLDAIDHLNIGRLIVSAILNCPLKHLELKSVNCVDFEFDPKDLPNEIDLEKENSNSLLMIFLATRADHLQSLLFDDLKRVSAKSVEYFLQEKGLQLKEFGIYGDNVLYGLSLKNLQMCQEITTLKLMSQNLFGKIFHIHISILCA